jgi:hypothetical protein
MEEQDLCLCGKLVESCECKHKCEFECNDEECEHLEIKSDEESPAVEVAEPAAEEVEAIQSAPEEVEVIEEAPVVEPDPVIAVVEPVSVPSMPEPVAAVPVVKVEDVKVGLTSAAQSQTANKFNSILGEKSATTRRYLSGRGTRY